MIRFSRSNPYSRSRSENETCELLVGLCANVRFWKSNAKDEHKRPNLRPRTLIRNDSKSDLVIVETNPNDFAE